MDQLEAILHAVDHIDGVGPRLLLDDEGRRVRAVEARLRARLLLPIFGVGDVTNPDRLVLHRRHDDVVEAAAVGDAPHRAQHQLSPRLVDPATRELHVLCGERAPHILDG